MVYLSNMSIKEALKYGSIEQIREAFENDETELVALRKQNAQLSRENDQLEESLYFAMEIIESAECLLKSQTRLSAFKKEFECVLENSLLDR